MALTRSMLTGMGLTEEQVGAIIEAHSETVNALKEQRDNYKHDSERADELAKELETLKSGDWQTKYNEVNKSFERYKKDVETKARAAKAKELYLELLKESGVTEDKVVLNSICNATDFGSMSINENGELENKEAVLEEINNKWSGFYAQDKVKGAEVQTPPENNVDMTKEGFFKLSGKERMEYANRHADWQEFYK